MNADAARQAYAARGIGGDDARVGKACDPARVPAGVAADYCAGFRDG